METKARKTTLRDRIGTAEPETSPATAIFTPPLPGEYWHGQGGIYVGIIRDGDKHFHLIMAIHAFFWKFSENYNCIPGEFSRSNGAHNMRLMLQAEPDNALVAAIKAYTVYGHNDFYLPSQFENNLICINAREHVEPVWHWSSTQDVADFAWLQDFEDGRQYIGFKDLERAARAVRRIPIQ